MEQLLETDDHLYEADLIRLDEAAELSQGGTPFAPAEALPEPPKVGKKGISMLQPLMKHMSAVSGKIKATMQVPSCQRHMHAESAHVRETGKQRSATSLEALLEAYNAKQHLNDSEHTDCGSVHTAGPGGLPSSGCSRGAIHQFACPSCDAMGAFTIFETPCSVNDVHFKQTCHTCQGRCIASAELIQCMKCKGLGCLGSWRKDDMQFKCDCTACKGKGYLAAVISSSQHVGSNRGQNDLGWSLVRELKQLTNPSDMEKAAKIFGASGNVCSMAVLTEAVNCSPFPSTQMTIIKAVAPSVFGDQCVVIEA